MAQNEIALPENLQIDQRTGELVIVWRWAKASIISLLVVFGLVAFLLSKVTTFGEVHWTTAFEDVIRSVSTDPFPFNLFVPAFCLAGLTALYNVCAHNFNHTRIHVSRSRLVIKHGPLPWFGNRSIASNEIRQIFSRPSPVRNRSEMATLWRRYDLLAIDQTGGERKLLTGLNLSGEQARYIEQKVERYLGITDSPVEDVQGNDNKSAIAVAHARVLSRPAIASHIESKPRTLVTHGETLVIVQRWHSGMANQMLFFSILWLAFACFFTWVWLTRFGSQPLLPILYDPALFVIGAQFLVGFLILYLAIGGLLNSTHLTIDRRQICVRHAPIPWFGNGAFATQDLKGLSVEKSSFGYGKGHRMVHKLEVHASLAGGKQRKLIGAFDTHNDALVVLQEIEGYLNR